MNNENMASFICELRKEKKLTQKQLAEKLNVTDKAVSKWERGLGYPDITLIIPLAEILGTSASELLVGARNESAAEKPEVIVQSTLEYAKKIDVTKTRKIKGIIELAITAIFITAIGICLIVNFAISQSITWALYPLFGIVFVWLVIIPFLRFKENCFLFSLLSLSIFIFPFLFMLEQITNVGKWFLPLAVPIAVTSLLYLWTMWFLIKKTRINKFYISAILVVLVIPLKLLINLYVAIFLSIPVVNSWDVLTFSIPASGAAMLIKAGMEHNKP